jgi:hypothetical protein
MSEVRTQQGTWCAYISRALTCNTCCAISYTAFTSTSSSTIADQASQTLCNWPLLPHDLLLPPVSSLSFNCSLGKPINRLWCYVSIDCPAVAAFLVILRTRVCGKSRGTDSFGRRGCSFMQCRSVGRVVVVRGGQVTWGAKRQMCQDETHTLMCDVRWYF